MRSLLCILCVLGTLPLCAASQQSQWRDLLLDLRYAVENQQAELSQLRQRIENQEGIVDLVREEAVKLQGMSRELLKSQSDAVGSKMASVEARNDHLKQDVQALQTYSTSVREHLEHYQSRLMTLESSVEQQSKNLKSLEVAVQALVEALQPEKSAAAVDSGEFYRVSDGDSLERIARRNRTTIRKLKELNNLTSDRIIIGQKLKIPVSDAQ